MLFTRNEIREELIKIFDINSPLSSEQYDLNPNNLLVKEENGKCQYDKIQQNLINNHPNIIPLLDYELISKINAMEEFMHKKNSFLLSNYLSNYLYYFTFPFKFIFQNSNKKTLNFSNLSSLNLNNISVNCLGNYLAFSSSAKKILLINIQDKKKFFINFSLHRDEFIIYIEWNPLIPYQFLVATTQKIFNCTIYQNNDNLDIRINNSFEIFPDLIKISYSYDGKFIILLYSNSIEIYNLFFEKIYSKTFLTKNFIDCVFNHSSNLFLVYSKSEIFLFNIQNLQFTSYSKFSGQISKVLFCPNDNYIFIFIESKSNELLLYILYNINDDNYNNDFFQSYNNSRSSYYHLKFKMYYNIFSLLRNQSNHILNIQLNETGDRLGILYNNKNGFNQLAIYQLNYFSSIQQFLIKPLCYFSRLNNLNVTQFIFSYDYNENKNILFCECNNELITKTDFYKTSEIYNNYQ